MFYYRLVACDVLTREACHCIARSPHAIDPVFTEKGEHDQPNAMRTHLQTIIDEAQEKEYDAILLAYGLCGNATVGLQARKQPLVIPRAHDCTTLFLGSKAMFTEHFGKNPSQTWASIGYSERGDKVIADDSTRQHLGLEQSLDELIELYGEENAQYMLDMLRTEHGSDDVVFIDVPETRIESVHDRIRSIAEAEGKPVREVTGSIRLIDQLLAGDWPEDDFLVVPPGHRIEAVYDADEVARAVPHSV